GVRRARDLSGVRIVLVSSLRGFGGGEEWFVTAAGLLAERGHLVRLVTRAGTALAAEARGRGLDPISIPFGGDADPRSVAALARIFREEETEVCLANLDKELRVAALASLAGRAVALVQRRGSEIPPAPTAL